MQRFRGGLFCPRSAAESPAAERVGNSGRGVDDVRAED